MTSSDFDAIKEARKQHDEANAAVAHLVNEGWLTDMVGGGIAGLGSSVAICPVCFCYVPHTNVAKVQHQKWDEGEK